ncbi:MAG: hypothetical protein HQ538_06600 [Parcubacteria group bacterium]|nr:hypothetical protein [Parcubacteria group bacterium]
MDIEVDYNPTPKTSYFISVGLNKKEAISFDNTIKGYRVMKQVLIKNQPLEKSITEHGKIDGEWEVIVLDRCKFIRTYHVKWIDKDKIDIINNEIWETAWVKPLDNNIHKKLLYYSGLVSDNYENLEKHKEEMEKFEKLLEKEIKKY